MLELLVFIGPIVALVMAAFLFRYRANRRVLAICIGAPVASIAFSAAYLLGLLTPIASYIAQTRIAALERAIYAGEPRTAFEGGFGNALPAPDSITPFYSIADDGTTPAAGPRLRRYDFNAGGAICVAYYRGLEVRYNAQDRIAGWKERDDNSGC